MKKTILIAALALVSALAAFGFAVYCPVHSYAPCYNTGQIAPSGAYKWHCTCGDDVWVP